MIYRRDGEHVLMDYEAIWVHVDHRPMATIRKYCVPIACDIASRLLLFDADEAAMILAKVKRREVHTRRRARG